LQSQESSSERVASSVPLVLTEWRLRALRVARTQAAISPRREIIPVLADTTAE